jgi:hypothetical protein
MKLIGLMPVRNEDWCLGLSLRAALMWCDMVIVFEHACTDGSAAIVDEVQKEFPERVAIRHDSNPQWAEMSHRWCLLQAARFHQATHIALIDADEILTGNLLPDIRDHIESLPEGVILQLPWLALPRTTERYLTSRTFGKLQRVSVAFKDDPSMHWETRNGYDHHHREPMGSIAGVYTPLKPEDGGLMHLQFLSEGRLRAKQALYQMQEVLRWPAPRIVNGVKCKTPEQLACRLALMYGRAVYESDPLACESSPIPESWWAPYKHLMHYLDKDAEPWQELEVRRLVKEFGREMFRGLDLFGVVSMQGPFSGERVLRCLHDPKEHFLLVPAQAGLPFRWIVLCSDCNSKFGKHELRLRESEWSGPWPDARYVGTLGDRERKTEIPKSTPEAT